jgi:hypothetical protein
VQLDAAERGGAGEPGEWLALSAASDERVEELGITVGRSDQLARLFIRSDAACVGEGLRQSGAIRLYQR